MTVIYCRISSDPSGQRAGVERQEAECRELAQRLGLEVSRVFIDNDASATSGKVRPAFEAMVAAKPDVILAWHLDRLTRRMVDLEPLINLDVPIHTVTAGDLDLTTPAGRAVARTLVAWATYEVEQKKARQKSAMDQAKAQGRRSGGRRPFGYEIPGMTIIEAEAEAIRWAFDAVLTGATMADISREWTRRGLRSPAPPRGQPDTAERCRWTPQAVSQMLRGTTVAGLRAHKGSVVGEAAWPAIVERATWEAVQQVLRDPSRSSGGGLPPLLLTSIARCGRCGAPVNAGGRNASRSAAGSQIYRCSAVSHMTIDAARVNAYVSDLVGDLIERYESWEAGRITVELPDGTALHAAPRPAGPDPRVGEWTREIEALEGRLDTLAGDLNLTERALVKRAAAIEARITDLRKQIADAPTITAPSELAEVLDLGDHDSYREAFEAADTATRRRVVAWVLDAAGVQVELHPRRGARSLGPDDVRLVPRGKYGLGSFTYSLPN